MQYAAYVGRVGALAIALGIGSAIAGPHIASADPGSSTGSASRSDHKSDARSSDTRHAPRALRSAGAAQLNSETQTGSAAKDSTPKKRASKATKTIKGTTKTVVAASSVDMTSSAKSDVKVVISEHDGTTSTVKDTVSAVGPGPYDVGVKETDTKDTTTESTTVDNGVDVTPKSNTDPDDGGSTSGTQAPTTGTGTGYEDTGGGKGSSSGSSNSSSTSTPTATVTVASVTPSGATVRPLHNVVLGVLGLFGYHPAGGASNNPILAGLWGTYRRIESVFDNSSPRITGAQVVGTTITADGRTAVTLSVTTTDLDGNALRYSTKNGADGTLTANADGTFTYVAAAGYTGSDTITITANDDRRFHFHGLLSFLRPNWGHTSAAKLTVTVSRSTAPTNAAPVIDVVTSTPGKGNTWTVTVAAHDTDSADTLSYTVAAVDADHVTVNATGQAGVYTVTVSDTAWAAANPGAQVGITSSVDDGHHEPAVRTDVVGTVNNAGSLDLGTLDAGDIPALPAGVTYLDATSTGYTIELTRSDGKIDRMATVDRADGSGHTFMLDHLPVGVTYTTLSRKPAGTVVLLRSDGQAVAVGAGGTIETGVIPAGDYHYFTRFYVNVQFETISGNWYYYQLDWSEKSNSASVELDAELTDPQEMPWGYADDDGPLRLVRSDGLSIEIN